MINAYKVLVEKPEGKRLIGRPKCKSEDDIRMDFRKIGRKFVEWVHVAQDKDQWRAFV
jgi:hypothetical protein